MSFMEPNTGMVVEETEEVVTRRLCERCRFMSAESSHSLCGSCTASAHGTDPQAEIAQLRQDKNRLYQAIEHQKRVIAALSRQAGESQARIESLADTALDLVDGLLRSDGEFRRLAKKAGTLYGALCWMAEVAR